MKVSTSILNWFDKTKRDLPFRKNKNPYNVWVSEIMLQQTKVETVIPYYNSWIKKFPDIISVSKAEETNLLKSWDLAGECLCPDCLALGKRKEILEKREKVLAARKEANFRKN